MARLAILILAVIASAAAVCDDQANPTELGAPNGGACADGTLSADSLSCCGPPTTTTTTTQAVTTTTTTTFSPDASTESTPSTVSGAAATGGPATSVTRAVCRDLNNPDSGVSDCPHRTALCSDPVYYDVMRAQCPKTCGFCGNNATSTACADRINPATGVSDCPSAAYLCKNAAYKSLMAAQCPRTCGLCTSG